MLRVIVNCFTLRNRRNQYKKNYWRAVALKKFSDLSQDWNDILLSKLQSQGGTVAIKIYVTPPPPTKGVYLPISKLHSKLQICHCGQISLQSATVNSSYLTTLGMTFILLAMVPWPSTLFSITLPVRATKASREKIIQHNHRLEHSRVFE